MNHNSVLLSGFALVAALAFGNACAADAELAPVSPEGLKLVPSKNVQVLYLREGADFSGYDQFAILECYVAFRNNWKKDQNSAQSFRVTDSDMVRIKADVAKAFRTVFVRGSRPWAKARHRRGQGVLILRPAIINLDIAVPTR
jgi:hypothetical protein